MERGWPPRNARGKHLLAPLPFLRPLSVAPSEYQHVTTHILNYIAWPLLLDNMHFVYRLLTVPSCQDYNKTCNRKSPCNKCKNISDCQTDGLMTIVSARGFQLATIQTDLDNSTAAGAIITHGTHGQNINGSWYNNTTVLLKGVAATTAPRKKRCVSRHIDNNKVDTDSDSMDADELENNPHAKSRLASKRKAEDEDEYVLPDLPVANTKGRSTRKGVRKNSAARATYYANIQNDKPEPFGQPKVHANTRQAACEALPWFKAYQSAAYTHKGVVYGLLCDKEVGPRDKFDDSIIVTRV
jgi:hypothetical protein